jgi:hypothetical protein
MDAFAVADTASWCKVCGDNSAACVNTTTSGSGDDNASTMTSKKGNGISVPVAGVIGALVTLAVVLGAEALIVLFSGLRLVKKSTLAATTTAAAEVKA